MLLGLGAGVGGNAILIQTALKDNAEGTVVVMAGMNSLDGLGQQGDDIAIAADIVVVAALAILGFATGYQVFHAERAVAFGGCAVADQQLHGVMFQWFHNLTEYYIFTQKSRKAQKLFFQNKWGPQDCTAIVPAILVITVPRNLRTLATVRQFTLIIEFVFFKHILFFTLAQRKNQRDIHPHQGLPLYGEDANRKSQRPPISCGFW